MFFVSASWAAPLALGLALTPADNALACPKDASALCESARTKLAEAQTAVQAAALRRALWTTAAEALREAQGAFANADYQGAERAADTAVQQARLGIAQTGYPTFPFPSDSR